MARKPKPPKPPKGKDRWRNVQVVQSANGLPVYIQRREGGETSAFRAAYLCDTSVKIIEFWSTDRGDRTSSAARSADRRGWRP
jgi:hypothetical protein